ncbi:Methyltransferase OMS1, mitochondrial [Wickerhamiella sorbophila]|uniref:Methyltransferase OMS1, mitochondrial n=1 Tax=Wickerhamiella sorbophila TaxID=45607 RepID=A0A2T0FIB3_9ASCO|nr:Methyltransferase OMS1, mitochondrial [Wickerhamiella sorbophila]PRT54725.1 Methyltransferase OMS1, mitochondrial [Wickerhamiella sorbophila]
MFRIFGRSGASFAVRFGQFWALNARPRNFVQPRGFATSQMLRQKPKSSFSVSQLLKDINSDPKKRKILAISLFTLYFLSGIAGFRYLSDTKYKATGDENPYKKVDSEGNIIDAAEIKVIEGHDTTPVYNRLAREYDDKIWLEEITSYIWYMRRKLMKYVKGDALEVSCGTGRNLKYLNPKKVSSITFLDSSLPMLEVTQEKFAQKFANFENVQFVQGRAENLVDLTAKSHQKFDTVYESFGLCSHEDPNKALDNMKKLVRPGGRIVLLEHGRGYFESMNERMDRQAASRAEEWGCRWNLDIGKIVADSGLEVEKETRFHFGTIFFYVLKVPKDLK